MQCLHRFHLHSLFECRCLTKKSWPYETTCADVTSSKSKHSSCFCEVLHTHYLRSVYLVLFWWHSAYGFLFSCKGRQVPGTPSRSSVNCSRVQTINYIMWAEGIKSTQCQGQGQKTNCSQGQKTNLTGITAVFYQSQIFMHFCWLVAGTVFSNLSQCCRKRWWPKLPKGDTLCYKSELSV